VTSNGSLKKIILVICLIIGQSRPGYSATEQPCRPVVGSQLATSKPGLPFLKKEVDRRVLDAALYEKYVDGFKTLSKDEIHEYFKTQVATRVFDAEEIIAAIDVLLPNTRSLFSIAKELKYIQIDEVEFSESVLKPRLMAEFEDAVTSNKASESLADRPNLSPSDRLILEVARRLHQLSLDALGERTLLTVPPYNFNQVAELDRYVSNLLTALKIDDDTAKEIFVRPWSHRLFLRELAYALGFAWTNPIKTYKPNVKNIATSVTDPEKYSRQLFWKLGPVSTMHWARAHLMLGFLLVYLVVLPVQVAWSHRQYEAGRDIYNVIQNSRDGQILMERNYERNLQSIYREKVNEMKKELERLRVKVRNDPYNRQLLDEMEALKDRIAYFEKKINP